MYDCNACPWSENPVNLKLISSPHRVSSVIVTSTWLGSTDRIMSEGRVLMKRKRNEWIGGDIKGEVDVGCREMWRGNVGMWRGICRGMGCGGMG